jgi:hypothetical protein
VLTERNVPRHLRCNLLTFDASSLHEIGRSTSYQLSPAAMLKDNAADSDGHSFRLLQEESVPRDASTSVRQHRERESTPLSPKRFEPVIIIFQH